MSTHHGSNNKKRNKSPSGQPQPDSSSPTTGAPTIKPVPSSPTSNTPSSPSSTAVADAAKDTQLSVETTLKKDDAGKTNTGGENGDASSTGVAAVATKRKDDSALPSADAPPAKRARRSSASYGPLSAKYKYEDSSALLRAFAPPQDVFDQAVNDVQRVADESGSTLDELLALPANVTNSRLMDKVAQLREKHAKILDEAILAIQDLLASAQIAEATRRTKELKDRLAAERKAAKGSLASRK